ncbi:MAG: tetratricopeptide repeat protein [Candidatus Eremiobacterota bacterium]
MGRVILWLLLVSSLAWAETAQELVQRADAMSQQGRYRDALELYNAAIRIDPGCAPAYAGRGALRAAAAEGARDSEDINAEMRYLEAIRDLDQAVALDPKNVPARRNRAACFYRTGRYEQARRDYTLALEVQPQGDLFASRGQCNAKLGRDSAAVADYTDAYRLDPNPAYLFNRANAYARLGEADKARADYRAVSSSPVAEAALREAARTNLAATPEAPRSRSKPAGGADREPGPLFFFWGIMLGPLAVVPLAALWLRRQNAQLPMLVKVLAGVYLLVALPALFSSLFRGLLFAASLPVWVSLFMALQSRASTTEDGFIQRAVHLMSRGHLQGAMEVLALGLARFPRSWQLLANRASVLEHLGEYERAQMDYSLAIERCPVEDTRWVLRAGRANALLGGDGLLHPMRVSQAEALLDDLLSEIPRDVLPFILARACDNRARIRMATGRWDEGLCDFDRAVSLSPTDVKFRVGRAQAYHDLGREAEARRDLEVVQKADPRLGERLARQLAEPPDSQAVVLLGHKGCALLQEGKAHQALGYFEKILKLDPGHAKAYQLRAAAYHALGQFQLELADLNASYELDGNEVALFNRGSLYLQLGRLAEAGADIREFLRIGRHEPTLEVARAILAELHACVSFREVSRLETAGSIERLLFSPSGAQLVSCSHKGATMCVWDVARGRQLMSLAGAYPAGFQPDGSHLIVTQKDHVLWIDCRTGKILARPAPLQARALSPDGRLLAGFSAEGHGPVLLDMSTGRLLHLEEACTYFRSLHCTAFSPDSRLVAVTLGPEVWVWSVEDGTLAHVTRAVNRDVTGVLFSPDASRLYMVTMGGSFFTYDLAAGQIVGQAVAGSELRGLALSGDGKWLAVGRVDPLPGVHVFHTEERTLLTELDTGCTWGLAFHGQRLATGEERGLIRLWEPETLQ